jgi:glycerophosphoryl diester phosphodiesterase
LTGGARVPDLAEALDLCHGRIVNVEVKADGPGRLALIRAVAREIRRARPSEIIVSSFDPAVVTAFAAFSLKAKRAILVGPRTPFLATALPMAMRKLITAAHLHDTIVSAARVERLRQAGLRVLVWTVNDAARARALAEWDVGTVITDHPIAVVSALSGLS